MSDIIDASIVPHFPQVTVNLSGEDGNAYFILAKVKRGLKGVATDEQITDFVREAVAGDYDHLLQTCMRWVNVE